MTRYVIGPDVALCLAWLEVVVANVGVNVTDLAAWVQATDGAFFAA
jgi:hypothetical protein